MGIIFVNIARLVASIAQHQQSSLSSDYNFMPSALWTRSDCLMLRSSMISWLDVSENSTAS